LHGVARLALRGREVLESVATERPAIFQVLLRVDETTYEPVRDYFKSREGKPMGKDHPIAWTHEPKSGGRFFYTEFGHDLRSLNTPFARQHVLAGILWAANKPTSAAKGTK